ncbi:MAG: response regulator transcription factor [Acutalibacteraceae bacterium]
MRLLLAEDERALSKALATILERSNYSVDTVYDGEAALEYLAADNYDGVILDIMMPKKDGITVLKELRSRGSKIPVLILTAKSEVDDKVLGLDSGANDYLTKPFHSRELLARIRAMTRTQSSQTSSVLQMGNITLDQRTYELSSPTGSFRLANREFQILELLMQNPGNLISAERLMEKIWGYDSETEISVVWVYISYLRKKLSALGANIQIRATRNVGYCLEEIA